MLLDKKEKEKTEREPGGLAGGFITITFLGYYDRKAGGHTHYRYTTLATTEFAATFPQQFTHSNNGTQFNKKQRLSVAEPELPLLGWSRSRFVI